MADRLSRIRQRWGDPLFTALTVLLALMMFVLAPLHAAGIPGVIEISFAIGFLMTAAVLVLSGNRVAVAALLVAIVLAAMATAVHFQQESSLDVSLSASAWTLLSLALIWDVGRAVFGPGRVTYHRIMGAVLLYLAVGMTFVALYTFIGLLDANALSGITVTESPKLASEMIYFSFGALTGAGSDISALSPVARSLSNVESIIGQLYPATLLARLVSLEIEDRNKG